MNTSDASKLADKLIQTWPSGPRHAAWFDVLVDEVDDANIGFAVFASLRTSTDRMSVAVFVQACHDVSGRRADADVANCEHCSGSGWVPARSLAHRGVVYEQVSPCPHCRAGRRVERSSPWRRRNERRDERRDDQPPGDHPSTTARDDRTLDL